jgi:hypothetical protein
LNPEHAPLFHGCDAGYPLSYAGIRVCAVAFTADELQVTDVNRRLARYLETLVMHASIAFLNGAASSRFQHRPRARKRAAVILRTLLGIPAR